MTPDIVMFNPINYNNICVINIDYRTFQKQKCYFIFIKVYYSGIIWSYVCTTWCVHCTANVPREQLNWLIKSQFGYFYKKGYITNWHVTW